MYIVTKPFSQLQRLSRDELIEIGVNELPDEMIFCPSCDRVVKLGVRSPQQQSGMCGCCGTVVTEARAGHVTWHKQQFNGLWKGYS